jgi:chorismate mutase
VFFYFFYGGAMATRGIRGATTVEWDDPHQILAATRQLLEAMLNANPACALADIASAWFTLTPDLASVYPAQAARAMGWDQVPLMCSSEIAVPGGLPRCIRVLLHWNTDTAQSAVRHVYLNRAASLRPDLVYKEGVK